MQLATAMSKQVATSLVTFSSTRSTSFLDGLRIETYASRPLRKSIANPWSVGFLKSVLCSDIVHIHQYCTMAGDLAALLCKFLSKPIFVTDHGGGGSLVLNRFIPIARCYTRAIAQSQYAATGFRARLQERISVIKGGIDTRQFCPDPGIQIEKKILFVGRITPHKGINYLIEAFAKLKRTDYTLTVLGRVYDSEFLEVLRQLAKGLSVRFIHDASDADLLAEYRSSRVAVLPSVATSLNGSFTSIAELMGMASLEAQACGTPVVCTDVAALPEFVQHERTGIVTRQNSPDALAAGIDAILSLGDEEYSSFRQRSRAWARQFDWKPVTDAHFALYSSALAKVNKAARVN